MLFCKICNHEYKLSDDPEIWITDDIYHHIRNAHMFGVYYHVLHPLLHSYTVEPVGDLPKLEAQIKNQNPTKPQKLRGRKRN